MEQCYSYPRFFSSLSEGSIDSSFGFESFSRCSSSDSSRSGGESLLFPLETSTSSPAHGVAYDSVSGNNDRLGMLHNTPGKYCVFDLGNSKIRNQSVTSPTPQQVSGKLAPFVHVGPSSTWDHQQHWQQQPVSRRSGESCNNQFDDSGSNGCFWTTTATALHEVRGDNNDYHQARPWRPSEEAHCGRGGLEPATATAKLGRHHQPRPRPRLSTSGGDPHCDLLKNGRDVAMDSVDMIQVRLRECGRLWRQTLDDEVSQPTKFGREPLKRRLAHIRALIREELEQASWRPPSESRPAGGPGPRRKRDRNAKRCKFCLSKKEDDDIVAHHNLFDSRGLVACPILQQYECELCHATGRHAHTLKYCPQNNPDTPHDVILQIRALIREELEQASWRPPSESRPAGGPGPRRKRDRNAKRCKFCLSKKEDDDIVAHHNLFDARGLVACPILQQYECELCHATGRHAHTLKYCPQNNPDTPHDVILQARLKLFLRNRRGQ